METKYRVARNPEDSNFCYFPFFEIMMTAEGKFKPCSKHGEFISHKGEVLTVENGDIDKAWNSDYMQQLRHNFNNDIQSHGCRECWRQQEMGLKEMRYDSYCYEVPESQVENPAAPMRVEINASNICNLKCRICMPTASHKWIKEAKDLYGWEETIHFNMTPENAKSVEKWVPNLMEIGFFGGEPLSSEENLDLLRYCVQSGHSKNIDILLNTNGTVYSDEIVELFSQFKHVFLNFSIDDIGERFEYQRKGAKWDKVVANLKKYLEHGGFTSEDTIECKICCSVTNMNIYYFPEYFEYMNEHFPGFPVFWNLIYEPWEYSVEILPEAVKDVIRDRLQNFVKTTYKMSESGTKTIENLITFLDNKIDRDFEKFFVKIAWHDKYRSESFASTFPEFWDLIAKYAPSEIPKPPFAEASANGNGDAVHHFDAELEVIMSQMKGHGINHFVREETLEEVFEQVMEVFEASIDKFSFDPDSTREKHVMVRRLFAAEGFDQKRFIAEALNYGMKRLVHMFNQNHVNDLRSIISEQYLSGFESSTRLALENEEIR